MTAFITPTTAPRTIAFRIGPRQVNALRAAALVVGGALFTAALAQVTLHLSWTPVPVTGQTFAVLLVSASVGMRLGVASQALYVVLGAIGLPFYAGGDGGWTVATGATAGYLVGFVLAAAVVGRLAERGQDRTVLTSLPAMLFGSAVIYACGATWLAIDLDVSATKAIELGVTPFLLGDAIKVGIVGLGLPLAWRLLGDTKR
ncbi:MAG: biotin transporter BioY [Ilumatobacteraceae bacterium]